MEQNFSSAASVNLGAWLAVHDLDHRSSATKTDDDAFVAYGKRAPCEPKQQRVGTHMSQYDTMHVLQFTVTRNAPERSGLFLDVKILSLSARDPS